MSNEMKLELLIATVDNLLDHLNSVNSIKTYEFRGPICRFSRKLLGLLVR